MNEFLWSFSLHVTSHMGFSSACQPTGFSIWMLFTFKIIIVKLPFWKSLTQIKQSLGIKWYSLKGTNHPSTPKTKQNNTVRWLEHCLFSERSICLEILFATPVPITCNYFFFLLLDLGFHSIHHHIYWSPFLSVLSPFSLILSVTSPSISLWYTHFLHYCLFHIVLIYPSWSYRSSYYPMSRESSSDS